MSLSEIISPVTIPVFPMVTFFFDFIVPSNSPSICKLHSMSIVPFIFVPFARTVVPVELELDLTSDLLKIAIEYVSPF